MNSFLFWRHFPRARDIHIVVKSNSAVVDNDTALAKEEDSKIADEVFKPEVDRTNEPFLEDGFAEEYDAFYMSEPCNKQETDEWVHSGGALARDYETFGDKAPDNLFHIKIPFIDVTELDFETVMDGNRASFVSGGFGDIFQARLSTMEEEVIVKIVKNMTFEDIRETRIQTYLMTSVCVPRLFGIIGGPEKPETMIIQQLCAKGKQFSCIYIIDC